jgi:2,3-bisphosphoglycerate-independent phosphoglycerate mutase
MSAFEVTAKVIEVIEKELYDIIIMNYANPDMVGHTGFLDAAIKAIETVDQCLGRVESAVRAKNGLCIITADHGNAEEMINFNENCSITAHSTSKVPFIICSNMVGQLRGQNIFKQNFEKACRLDPGSGDFGALCDISPTILTLMDLGQPPEMTGKSLVGE